MKIQLAQSLRLGLLTAGLGSLPLGLGCSSSGGEAPENECPEGEVEDGDGKCAVDPYRWEPAEQLDVDNVVNNGPNEPTELVALPPPPKSGFRIIMEPQTLEPGADRDNLSQCWQIPELAHRWIYTARIHTSPGMHHANLYGTAIDPKTGPQPKGCSQRADSRIFGGFMTALGGQDTSDVTVPTVLFANSTQVRGTDAERYALAPGYAYELPEGFEVMTDIHLQNTSPDTIVAEAAWDFFTMPAAEVTNPAAMFVWLFYDFLIPTNGKKTLTAECEWAGGEVAAIMPHTHQWATGFNAEFGTAMPREYDGDPQPGSFKALPGLSLYERTGTGNLESDIQVYSPPVDTSAATAVKFQCHFENTTEHDMCFGIGENEMCFLFGYVSPPEVQRLGVIVTDKASCITFDPAERGDPNTFDIVQWALTQTHDPDVLPRLGQLSGALNGGGVSFQAGCGGP